MRLAPSLAAFLFTTALGVTPALAGPDGDPKPASDPRDHKDQKKADAPKDPPKDTPKDTPKDAAKDKAQAAKAAELVKKSAALCEGGEVDEGLAGLAAAWAQRQDVDTAIAYATCEMKAQRWAGAAERLAFALRHVDEGEQRKGLEKSFLAVRDRVGAIKVTVNVEGADVFVGDRYAGQAPLAGEVYVMPGAARVSAKKPGFAEAEKAVEVQARGTVTVALELGSERGAPRIPGDNRSTAPAWALAGVGLAAAGVGAALYAGAVSKGAAADDILAELRDGGGAQPCRTAVKGCATVKSLREGHDTFANVGTGLLIGGGVLLASGIIYGLWATAPSRGERSGSFTFTPVASPSGGALFVTGTF